MTTVTSIGIDIGSGAVKTALFRQDGDSTEWLAKRVERIRQRDPMGLARTSYEEILEEARLKPGDVEYTATTGEGENVKFATGHFYSMTTHARGAIYLRPTPRRWWTSARSTAAPSTSTSAARCLPPR